MSRRGNFFQGLQQFGERFSEIFKSKEAIPYAFLLGAGFSRSAGIPAAQEIVHILARYKVGRTGKASWSLEDAINDFYENGPSPAALKAILGKEEALEGIDFSELYQRLFSDPKIFPNGRRSQAAFVDSLLRTAEKHRYGWNFEGAYLGYLCDRLAGRKQPFFDTILTTNFDNVLPNSFSIVGSRFRLLDHPLAISDEAASTPYPRLTYLHGRYTNYQLINSKEDIELLRRDLIQENVRPNLSGRLSALKASLINVAREGGLIVLGYEGWEDVIMAIVERELQREGSFEPGVFWCLYGDRGRLRPNVHRLGEEYGRFWVVENVTALDVMRTLLNSAGISEAEVMQKIEHDTLSRHENLRWRWVQVQHLLRGWDEGAAPEDEYPFEADVEKVERACDKALLDPRYSALANALIKTALRSAESLERAEVATLIRCRGELFLRYSYGLSDAVSDFHTVLGLSEEERGRALLGLAEAYRALGNTPHARTALLEAYSFAIATEDDLLLARCRFLHAGFKYDINKLARAQRLTLIAASAFEKHDRLDLSALCYILLAGMNGFNNKGMAGLGLAEVALSYARKCESRFAESRARHIQGFCFTALGEYSSAIKALTDARGLALEGPNYGLLAETNVLLADCYMSEEKVEEAVGALEEAVEILGLLSSRRALAQAKVWRDLYRLHLKSKPSRKTLNEVFATFESYESLEDKVISATQWAVLAADLMSFPNRTELDEHIWKAIRKCQSIAKEFLAGERKAEALLKPGKKRPEAQEFQLQLAAHVEEHLTSVTLLYYLLGATPTIETKTRGELRAMYRGFQRNYERFDFASIRTKAIMAIVSHLMKQHEILSDSELVRYRVDLSNSQFEAEAVREFCKKAGFWWYQRLVK